MDPLLRLFDLFNGTAKKMAVYLPQSGQDVLQMFKDLIILAGKLNFWIYEWIGVDLKIVLNSVGRIAVFLFNFLFDLLKTMADKL